MGIRDSKLKPTPLSIDLISLSLLVFFAKKDFFKIKRFLFSGINLRMADMYLNIFIKIPKGE
tara:strand:- start:50 stop:235 length:186 start_codon:yes stop_codon:yes gene_type:complete